MKSSKRDIFLLYRKSNNRRKYFSLQNALKSAVTVAVEQKLTVTIYDSTRGLDVALVLANAKIDVLRPRTFGTLWGRVK